MKAAFGMAGAALAAAAALAAVLAAADSRERRARRESGASALRPAAGPAGGAPANSLQAVSNIPGPVTDAERAKADLLAAELADADAAKAELVAAQMSSVHPGAALAALRAAWSRVARVEARLAFLNAIEEGLHPRRADFWDFGMKDKDASVRGRAADVLGTYAFRDFSVDPAGYADWSGRLGGLPSESIRRSSAAEFVAAVSAARGHGIVSRLDSLRRFATPEGLADLARAGLPDLLGVFLTSEDVAVVRAALVALTLFPRDGTLLHGLTPDLLKRDPSLVEPLLRLLADPACRWAFGQILPLVSGEDDGCSRAAAEALETLGERMAVPELAKAILADPTGRVAGLAGPSLARMTKLDPAEPRDFVWWSSWWQANRETWDPSIRKGRGYGIR
jgi:hypothetical protein